MKTQTEAQQSHESEAPKKGFLAGILDRIDQAMKSAAEKKAQESCCCSSDDKESDSGKGGKCC